jgi:hypothetical protein
VEFPAITVADPGVTENAKYAALPLKFTTCGLPAALSVIVNEPVLLPVAVGVKVTLMVQLAPAGKDAPQVLISPKSPVARMFVIIKGAVPVLLNVTACAALVVPKASLGKVRLVGERVTNGLETPIPVRRTIWGLPSALSIMARAPTLDPGAVGLNVTLTTQLVAGWRGAVVQLFV